MLEIQTISEGLSEDLSAVGNSSSETVDVNGTGFAASLFLATDGHYETSDASSLTAMPCSAVALETGTGTKVVLHRGFIRNDAWSWTIGEVIYASETGGAFTQTAPSTTGAYVQVVGIAKTADIMEFNPSFNMVKVK